MIHIYNLKDYNAKHYVSHKIYNLKIDYYIH